MVVNGLLNILANCLFSDIHGKPLGELERPLCGLQGPH